MNRIRVLALDRRIQDLQRRIEAAPSDEEKLEHTSRKATLASELPTPKQRALVQLACSHACTAAVRAVEKIHACAGATANFLESPLERCSRDVQVVRQHIMVSPQWTEATGRVLLGLDSNSMLL